jgi:hypothetical protein
MTASVLLQRITTEYVEVEDRIRLIAEVHGGPAVVLWLSQRLLGRLLPSLIQWLDGQGGSDATFAHLLHGFAQQAAQSELTPQAPVRAEVDGPRWLVHSVDVGGSANLMTLTFRDRSGQAATLSLEVTPMRQWLSILRDLCHKAGWMLNVWPEWFESGTEAVNAKGLTFH